MKSVKLLTVAAISLSLISLELIWTRIFSAEYFYTFAFLILSQAILGLGLGALTLRLFPRLNNEKYLGTLLALTGVSILLGPALVFKLGLDFSTLYSSWSMIVKFIAALVLLTSSFFMGGIALALVFRNHHIEMPRLYRADLVGAGAGVLVAVFLMNEFGTPYAAFLSAVPVLVVSIFVSTRFLKIVPLVLVIIAVSSGSFADNLLKVERKERIPVIYEHWDAMAKIKMGTYGEDDLYRNLNIDNLANTPIAKFDGNWDRPDSLKFWFDIDVKNLMNQFKSCTFLSLGAGGGRDVMQALQNGASEVHAVEVIPHINHLMIEGELAEYTGRIYHDPRVVVASEDARAYVRRFENKFDIIYSLSSNTWAAVASGSFALAENYLFTTEAFVDYWSALSDSGYLMMEHQFYMPRIVSEVKDALALMNVENLTNHFAIYRMPKKRRDILLLSKKPLTEQIIKDAFGQMPEEYPNYKYLQYPAADSVKNNLINRIAMNGWEYEVDSAKIDISPTTDNRPFIAQMGLWKNFNYAGMEKISFISEIQGFPLSKINIVIILAVIIVLVIPLNLLPYFFRGEKLKVFPWLYFFTIGMAFMFVEIVLIQKYTLLIGSSVYSLVTILLTLLVSSGIGSRFARRIDSKIVFPFIMFWIIMDALFFNTIIYASGGFNLVPRILITVLLLAPLGFFMGIPFPKAAVKVGELVDWGFAVNGTASVLGSTLVVLLVLSFGFSFALVIGATFYALAWLLISKVSFW